MSKTTTDLEAHISLFITQLDVRQDKIFMAEQQLSEPRRNARRNL